MMGRSVFGIILCIVFVAFSAMAEPAALSYSTKEKAAVKKALHYAKRHKFERALQEAGKVDDTLVTTLVKWMRYREHGAKTTYEESLAFIEAHPHWPSADRIRRQAEYAIRYSTKPQQVIEWFKDHSPQTAHGKWLLANARIAKNVEPETVNTLIRESWVEGEFTAKEERDFVKKHRKRLRKEDHIARIDRLLWERKATAANRILKYADSGRRKLFKARMLLIRNRRGLNRAISEVPESLENDPGLLYERARWRQKRNRVDGVLEMVKRLKDTTSHAKEWWRVRHILARDLLKAKRYKDAYFVVKHHSTEAGGAQYAQAQWLAGWIALRFLKQPRTAYEYFYKMYSHVSFPISLARASYWAGRAAAKNNNAQIAQRWFTLSSQHPTTFYGQLSNDYLQRKVTLSPENDYPEPTRDDRQRTKDNALLKVAHILMVYKENYLARKFTEQAIVNATSPGEMALISEFGQTIDAPSLSVTAAKEAHQHHQQLLLKTNYPHPKYRLSKGADRALAYAIIRQESMFNPIARSGANARGLMQLIPSTARRTARKLGLRYNTLKLTRDPDYNTRLGSHYISGLVKHQKESLILAIASYNAGPGNVRKWVRSYGDPRKIGNINAVIDWVEMIPYSETRNYVQRVLENKQVYASFLTGEEMSLSADLVQGK